MIESILDMVRCGIDKEEAIDSYLADVESEKELSAADIRRLRDELTEELNEFSHSHYNRVGMNEKDFL